MLDSVFPIEMFDSSIELVNEFQEIFNVPSFEKLKYDNEACQEELRGVAKHSKVVQQFGLNSSIIFVIFNIF